MMFRSKNLFPEQYCKGGKDLFLPRYSYFPNYLLKYTYFGSVGT